MLKYQVVWSNEDCCDSAGIFDSLEDAIETAKEILKNWSFSETSNWKYDNNYHYIPTTKQIEDYDYMIDNCYVYIVEVDENGERFSYDEDEEIWLKDDDYYESDWLYWDELKEKYNKIINERS